MVDRRRFAGYCAAALATAAALLALAALLTGGFRVYVFGIALSARGEHRAALFALTFTLIAIWLLDRERRVPHALAAFARSVPAGVRRLAPLIPVLPLVAAVVVAYLGIAFGARAAGASDTYGYISQAHLWLQGDLRVTRTELTAVPWPNGDWTFTPLGYKDVAPQTIAPTYAPGLPLLMAGAFLAFGSCGPFVVSPICGGLLVLLTYLLGRRVSGSTGAAALASVCVATSPMVLMMTVWPMSDVPAAAFWAASLVLACSSGLATAAGSGAVAGLAILIRPNLAPLALVPLALTVWWSSRITAVPLDTRRIALRVALFGIACAPAVLFLMWLFNELYGSPFESGYGSAADLYAWAQLAVNTTLYPQRLLLAHGPVPFLFLISPFLAWRRGAEARRRWLLLAFIALAFGAYAFYEPFEAWWYLRFLLPAFAPLFVLAFDAIDSIRILSGRIAGSILAFVLGSAAFYHSTAFSAEAGVLRSTQDEDKYASAARFVADNLPPNSVILSMQHSGTVRLYAGRLTLRYDVLDPAWLDRTLEYLKVQGYDAYVLLDDWEVDEFRRRFAGQAGAALVERPPLAIRPKGNVFLFSTTSQPPAQSAAIMPAITGCQQAGR